MIFRRTIKSRGRPSAVEEYCMRDGHLDGEGEIISRKTIEHCIDHGVAYRIRENGEIVGGLILKIDEQTQHNELEILFVSPDVHSKGVGTAALSGVKPANMLTLIFSFRDFPAYSDKIKGVIIVNVCSFVKRKCETFFVFFLFSFFVCVSA